jgi:hypothetical protein
MTAAVVSIDRRDPPAFGPLQCERHECLSGSRHRPGQVEPKHEQAGTVERVNRSTCQGRTLTDRPVLGEGRVQLWSRGRGAA